MNYLTIVLISVALAMDALAVSIACGIKLQKSKLLNALKIAFFFGAFQLFMPIIGAVAGSSLKSFLLGIDHYIILGILGFIGAKMIYESFIMKEEEEKLDPSNLKTLLVLSIATSIDAFAVGVSLPLLIGNIYTAACIIGIITFVLCFIGVLLGDLVGHFFEEKIEAVGGLILIGIGIKIFISHILNNQ